MKKCLTNQLQSGDLIECQVYAFTAYRSIRTDFFIQNIASPATKDWELKVIMVLFVKEQFLVSSAEKSKAIVDVTGCVYIINRKNTLWNVIT